MSEEQINSIFNKHSWAALGAISPSKSFCLPAMREAMEVEAKEFAEFLADMYKPVTLTVWEDAYGKEFGRDELYNEFKKEKK